MTRWILSYTIAWALTSLVLLVLVRRGRKLHANGGPWVLSLLYVVVAGALWWLVWVLMVIIGTAHTIQNQSMAAALRETRAHAAQTEADIKLRAAKAVGKAFAEREIKEAKKR